MFPRTLYRLALLLLLAGTFSSCRKEVANRARVDAEAFKVQPLDFRFLQAKGKLAFESSERNLKASTDMRMQRDSLIWISMRVAGIEGMRILATPDSLMAMNRLEKTLYCLSYQEVSQLLKASLNFNILQSLLLGELPEGYDMNTKALADEKHLVLRRYRGDFKTLAFVNRDTYRLDQLNIQHKNSRNMVQIAYTDFLPVQQMLFPGQSRISIGPHKDDQLTETAVSALLELQKVELSDEPMDFPFRVPDKYDRLGMTQMLEALKKKPVPQPQEEVQPEEEQTPAEDAPALEETPAEEQPAIEETPAEDPQQAPDQQTPDETPSDEEGNTK